MKNIFKRMFALVLVLAMMAGMAPMASAYYSCKHSQISSRSDSRVATMLAAIDSQAFKNDTSRNNGKARLEYLLFDSKYNPFDKTTFPYLNGNGYVSSVTDGNYKYTVNGAGCFAYAKWAEQVVYAGTVGDRLYPTDANGKAVTSVSGLTADIIKNFMVKQCQAGEHIRIDETHSIMFISCDESGYYYTEYISDSKPYIRLCYSTYSQFLSALKTAGKHIWVYNSNKYVNDGSVAPTIYATVNYPTDSNYTSKISISDNSATIVTNIKKLSGSSATGVGVYIYDENGKQLKNYYEAITNVSASNTSFHSWFNTYTDMGLVLDPGTTYKYKFYVIVNGETYEGSTYSFTTTGTKPTPVVYHAISYYGNGGAGSMTGSSVAFGSSFTLPECAFTLEGYEFYKWVAVRDGDSKYQAVTADTGAALGWQTRDTIAANDYRIRAYDAGESITLNSDWTDGYSGNSGYTFWAVWKPIEVEEPEVVSTIIELQINNPRITVDGVSYAIDALGTTPVILNSRTLLPIRAVIEAMGGTVKWDGSSKIVTLNVEGRELNLQINSKSMWDSTTVYTLDTAPVIIGGRTMLPVRAVAEYFGASVAWDSATKTTTITYPAA